MQGPIIKVMLNRVIDGVVGRRLGCLCMLLGRRAGLALLTPGCFGEIWIQRVVQLRSFTVAVPCVAAMVVLKCDRGAAADRAAPRGEIEGVRERLP